MFHKKLRGSILVVMFLIDSSIVGNVCGEQNAARCNKILSHSIT